MSNFTVRFAGLNINITTIYDYTYNFCKEYLTDGTPDFSVTTTEEKIAKEIEISEFTPTKPYAESICVYREIAEKLPLFNRFIFHGAAISYKNNGYIFTAVSGTGKSTHISLWKQYLGDDVEIVNGDKPIINIDGDDVIVYSTPYAGKEGWQNHKSAKLKGVCIVERGNVNQVKKVDFSTYLNTLFKQVYKPYDINSTIKTIELFNEFSKLPLYLMQCDISENAVKASFNAMTGLDYDQNKLF